MQAEPDGPASSDEPRVKRYKPTAAEEEEGQQASGSKGNSREGDIEPKRQVAGGEEEQGEEAVVGHREEEEQGEAAPDAQAAPAMPWGSMPPGNTPPHAVRICCESVVTG